jgi:hypothetical protein
MRHFPEPHRPVALAVTNLATVCPMKTRDTIKQGHEKAVADQLLDSLQIRASCARPGDSNKREPDVTYTSDGKTLGIEVVTAYYANSDAEQEGTAAQVRGRWLRRALRRERRAFSGILTKQSARESRKRFMKSAASDTRGRMSSGCASSSNRPLATPTPWNCASRRQNPSLARIHENLSYPPCARNAPNLALIIPFRFKLLRTAA